VLGGGQNWPRTGGYALNQFGVEASEIITNFLAGTPDWATPQSESYTGQPRTSITYVPANYDPSAPMPVVVGLHGRYGTGAGHASLTDTNRLAEEQGFIAVYPDGLSRDETTDTGWNYFKGAGIYQDVGADDTAFIVSLLDDLALDLNIDRDHVYVNGLSNGGFMVHRLACEVPEIFAGYADIAGSGFTGVETLCDYDIREPVRMLIIHGTDDNNVFWDGRLENVDGRQFYSVMPIPQMLGFWADYNQCQPEADTTDLPQQGQSPGTAVRILSVTGCQENSAVVLYAIIGGGHNWPGIAGAIPDQVAGRVNLDIHATDVMWAFFSGQLPE
jgi:polyhydroxybutyrate depolymerase